MDLQIVTSLKNDGSFKSLDHPGKLMSGLKKLHSTNQLYDITLIVEGEKIMAHKVVLAACSDYFRAMFTVQMKEAHQSEIHMQWLRAESINTLIDFCYTSSLTLTKTNVPHILQAANFIQMETVVNACSEFLEKEMDLCNCVEIAKMADLYCMKNLKEKTYLFMSSKFSLVTLSREINSLTWEQFHHLLNCDYPFDCSEGRVLEALLNWLAHQELRNGIHNHIDMEQIIESVNFKYVKAEEFTAIAKKFSKLRSIYTIIEVMLTKIEGIRKDLLEKNLLNNEDVLVNIRGTEYGILKIGGLNSKGITNNVTCYLPSRKKWYNLTNIPHAAQSNYGTAVLNNKLYVFGGCLDAMFNEDIHPFGFRYCPIKDNWDTVAPMQRDRYLFPLIATNRHLYAIAGATGFENLVQSLADGASLSNCERYDVATNSWQCIPPLPDDRAQHAGCAYNYLLLVSGGRNAFMTPSFWKFDTRSNVWEQMPPMLSARADHVMLVINDKLYVCGGWTEDENTAVRQQSKTLDVFDFERNLWEIETYVPTPKYHSGIAAIGTKIYMIGGLNSDTTFDRATASIHCYDIATKQWERLEDYPQRIWECTCVSLYMSRCRDDLQL